jgi:septum site-determining protein MinD
MSIIVTTGELPAMRDAQRTANAARDIGVKDVRLVVNRLLLRNFKFMRVTIDDVIDTVSARLIGVIPEDKFVFMSLHENIPLILYKKRLSAYEFLDVARRITGEDVPLRIR